MAWSLHDKSFSLKLSSYKDILKVLGISVLILSGEIKIGHIKSTKVTSAYPIILAKLIVGAYEKLTKESNVVKRRKYEQSLGHAIALFKAFIDTTLTPVQKALDFTTFELLNMYNSYLERKGYKKSLTLIMISSMVVNIAPAFIYMVKTYSVQKLLSLALFLLPIGITTKLLLEKEIEIPVIIPKCKCVYKTKFSKYMAQFDAIKDTYLSFTFINTLLPLASLTGVKLLLSCVLFWCSYITAQYNHFKYKEMPKCLSRVNQCILGVRPGKESQQYLEKVYKELLIKGLPVAIACILYPILVSLYTHVNVMWAGITIPCLVSQSQMVEREFQSLNMQKYYSGI